MITTTMCRHRFVFDEAEAEVVCEACGITFKLFEHKELEYAPSGRKLSSPSVKNGNLGSDQDRTIKELRHYHLLSGALRFFPRSTTDADEDLIAELSNRLHGRVSDDDLAAIAAVYRKLLAKLERERRQKAMKLLDQLTGVNGHEE